MTIHYKERTEQTLFCNKLFLYFNPLEKCQQSKIDILITDINMPGLKGLQLLNQLKHANRDLQIIILTGFGSFSYAKEAMKFGVKFFLEKPVLPELLYQALNQSIELAERHQIELSLYRKKQIEQFLSASGKTPFPSGLTYPFCLYLFDTKFYAAICQLLVNYPNQNQLVIGQYNKVGYILNNSQHETFHTYFKEQLIQENLSKGIAIDCLVENEKEFLRNFQIGSRNLDKAFYFDQFVLIRKEQFLNEKIYENTLYLDFREDLLQHLTQGELTACQKAIEQFFFTCRKELYTVQLLRLQVNELLSTIFDLYPIKPTQFFDDYSPKIMLLNDWKELQFMLIRCINSLRETLNRSENMNLAQKVNLIIEEYYDREDFSLKWIATHLLFLNPEYLGKAYYKETGIRFNKKLAEYRIQKAKEHLENNFKVYEVAALTGFGNSPEYFVQTFKKITGQTPKQFSKVKEPL